MTVLSIPIDVLATSELIAIQGKLTRRYLTDDSAGSVVVDAINMIRRELNERNK